MAVPFHSERRRDVRGARQRGGDARRVGDASSLGETCEERREVDVVVHGEDGHHLGRAARSAPLLEDLRATCVANLLRAQRTLSLVPDADARLRRVRIEGRAGRVASSGRKRETRAMRPQEGRGAGTEAKGRKSCAAAAAASARTFTVRRCPPSSTPVLCFARVFFEAWRPVLCFLLRWPWPDGAPIALPLDSPREDVARGCLYLCCTIVLFTFTILKADHARSEVRYESSPYKYFRKYHTFVIVLS